MLRIALFLIFLSMAIGYAIWKGGMPERVMAAILIAMALMDQALHVFIPAHFATVDTGHLAIDLLAAASTISLAIVAHRFWPMAAAVLQILPLLAHFSRALDLSTHPIAYLTMQVASSWLLPPLLALGTWRHRLRLQRNGRDPSWQISLKSSSRSMEIS